MIENQNKVLADSFKENSIDIYVDYEKALKVSEEPLPVCFDIDQTDLTNDQDISCILSQFQTPRRRILMQNH